MADGYARASGSVGVAIATSGPGATNMVTGIATAMMDSSPIVCITGQVGSRLIGSDAFQETDITGITLPITKHNYLVTRAEDVAPRSAKRLPSRAAAGPVRCWSTSPRTRSRRSASSTGTLRRRSCAEAEDERCRADGDCAGGDRADQRGRASGDPRRARHHAVGRRAARCSQLAEHAQIPIAVTLLGHRRRARLASAQSRDDGHARRGVGQQRDSGSRPADRARHALRRSRHRQPQDLCAATRGRSTSTSIAPS